MFGHVQWLWRSTNLPRPWESSKPCNALRTQMSNSALSRGSHPVGLRQVGVGPCVSIPARALNRKTELQRAAAYRCCLLCLYPTVDTRETPSRSRPGANVRNTRTCGVELQTGCRCLIYSATSATSAPAARNRPKLPWIVHGTKPKVNREGRRCTSAPTRSRKKVADAFIPPPRLASPLQGRSAGAAAARTGSPPSDTSVPGASCRRSQ